jgi:hypothetical protein
MTDRPIIFSGPMVRALLAGRKTQTRRLATSPLRRVDAGDRLYVREHWRGRARMDAYAPRQFTKDPSRIAYLADGKPVDCPLGEWTWGKHRQGMHMPRWASRLTLIIEAVKIEPLQMLEGQHPLESEALAEGVHRIHHGDGDHYYSAFRDHPDPHNWTDPTDAFRELWNSLHTTVGERWEDNPDVVALTFRVERGNIDSIGQYPERGIA